jgi:transposase
MLIVETIAKIRRQYFVEGKKIKQICRELRLSRNTVRNAIRSGDTEHRYRREHQVVPKLGPYLERLNALLEENQKRPRKRRLKARGLYELLVSEGYAGGYDSVRRYVKKWLADHHGASNGAYIPLAFPPGDAYQFDWSHEQVVLGGIVQTVKVAHLRLCHSRKFYVVAYPRESLEMVFDAHAKAFAHFGGTCRRGIYDNMPTAVDQVLPGKEREFNKRFQQMCSHYLVEPVACSPGSGWEKGQIEKQVQDVRNWLFIPRPRFADLSELNGWLADRCQALCETRPHPTVEGKTIEEVFQEEKEALIAVGARFAGCVESEGRVSSTSLVHYDRNHYSVDSRFAGKTATIRVTADRIQVIGNGELIADHQRQFGRDKTIYDPWHYLEALHRKPGALRNGAPFQNWPLPASLQQVQRHLLQHLGGDREFVDILRAARQHGLEIVEEVCRTAIAQGTTQGEVILNLVSRAVAPPVIEDATIPAWLQLHEEPIADCGRYDSLRQGGGQCIGMN